MGYALAPLAVILMYLGLQMIEHQTANSVPGAGILGSMKNSMHVAAEQAEMWGTACTTTAAEASGIISSAIQVTLPSGVNEPNTAGCITTPAPSNGRNVYAYISAPHGVAGQVLSATNMNYTWYRVTANGEATNLVDGSILTVPAVIPLADLVEYELTSN